jgi:hypothetical protein
VEAQAAGLPIVASDSVPPEADMGLGLMERLSLQDGIETWLQANPERSYKRAAQYGAAAGSHPKPGL